MSATGPSLFATASTVEAIAEARAVAVLIGGYDGSGNYGDIALLEAALDLVERLGPDLLVLPMLERGYLQDHQALSEHWGQRLAQPIFFDPESVVEDEMMPVAAPGDLAFGALYLYGGGYLNSSWGNRKLAMLRAAETLLATGGAGRACRLSSGLQVQAAWTEALADSDASTMRSFDFLGARDGISQRALATLGSAAPTVTTGDDAIGLLQRVPAPVQRAANDERLHVNLHFAEHEWTSDRPQALLDFYVGFTAELGRLAGRPVLAQPLLAYLDSRIDERPAVERLAAACSTAGIEVAEPLLLRPAGLAAAALRLGEASLTLSCSFHVALTSLMLEIPTVLVGDNAYYQQKAAGLAEDFDLPAAFTTTADADPVASAREIAGAAIEGDDRAALRRRLAAGASRQRQRRAATETELLGHLGSAATSALGGRVTEQAERLRQRSAEPAELHARLATLQTELEELRRRGDESPLDAELRVQTAETRAAEAQETLAVVLGSRSWRMAAPLRRARSRLRRAGSRPGRD